MEPNNAKAFREDGFAYIFFSSIRSTTTGILHLYAYKCILLHSQGLFILLPRLLYQYRKQPSYKWYLYWRILFRLPPRQSDGLTVTERTGNKEKLLIRLPYTTDPSHLVVMTVSFRPYS